MQHWMCIVLFLKSHYDAGHFLMSGARTPRDGGIILAQASDRDEVSRWLQDDPFCKAGVAEYQIKEWNITMSAPAGRHQLTNSI
jgi:uncharacterized protein YciI